MPLVLADVAAPVALAALVLLAATAAVTRRGAIPTPALLLAAAAVASDLVGALRVEILTVERVAIVALVVILLNGGRDIGAVRLRRSLGDISSLGLLGTLATAAAVAVIARVVLGLDWAVAGVLGAALAPTDPAVVFSVLGRREVEGRSGTVLEGEAGVNDPAGIALLLGMVEVATHPGTSLLVVGREFALAMGIGGALGLVGGRALVALLRRAGGPSSHGILTLAVAGALYGATDLVGGSGFLAVFVAGLLLGDARPPGEPGLVAGLASIAEVAVFVALGLTIDVGGIAGQDWLGAAAIFVAMTLVVRPLVVLGTLARSRLGPREKAFIAWSGLKGAVPILLAAFAVLDGVPNSARVYDVVFVVVLASIVVQGGLLLPVAARLRIPMHLKA